MSGVEANPRPAGVAPDRSWRMRWGANLMYFAAIGLMYFNARLPTMTPWLWVLVAVLVPMVIAGVVWRVRLPYLLPIASVVAAPLYGFSLFLIGVVSLSMRRKGLGVWLMTSLGAVGTMGWLYAHDYHDGVPPADSAVSALLLMPFLFAPIAVGRYISAHRRLAASVAESAARAEFERELAASQAVHRERERIAQEMHDSLGHVLALVTMQAGALEVGSKDPDVAKAAEQIRSTARSGLSELRAVVHALGEDERRDPTPGLQGLPRLIGESRDAGAVVTVRDGLAEQDRAALPPSTGRVAYQVIHEALTNAHRHAPGAAVDVVLSGAPGESLEVRVGNPLTPGGESGAGTGLSTLRGRLAVLGGELDARASRGRFELCARLPWEATA
ncbi:MAG: hypothetical protein IPJ61_06390 [Tessaracoccus sp.]|uniref:sensor histidine kinase n=1 Tax=Tessaracoccus sp. TaxID=1971211 RepID=UPI001EC964DD|nr:histidine kinase [Tessaracoccus sp.]MBK7820699.1 hypothetical protein [Tessaracoccus sp.]